MTASQWTRAALMLIVCLWASAAYAAAPLVLPINRTLTSAVRDVNGVRPDASTDPSTLLYTAALRTPLLAPDGHQLTWGEWMRPEALNTSTAIVKCVEKGTHVTLQLTGLIPNALYSAWLFVRPTETSPVDAGKLPSITTDSNGFVTNGLGSATLNVIAPAGPLSISGEITSCLFDFFNFSFNLAYHSDGRLYGDVPGPDGITLQQFNFAF
jgi:hypothetical protein